MHLFAEPARTKPSRGEVDRLIEATRPSSSATATPGGARGGVCPHRLRQTLEWARAESGEELLGAPQDHRSIVDTTRRS